MSLFLEELRWQRSGNFVEVRSFQWCNASRMTSNDGKTIRNLTAVGSRDTITHFTAMNYEYFFFTTEMSWQGSVYVYLLKHK